MSSSVGIVGTGASARALAAYLGQRGKRVHLLTRDARRLGWLERHDGMVRATGKIEGRFPIASAGDDPAAFARACEVIYLATVTTAYPEVAATLGPHVGEHRVVCFSAKLGGSAVVADVFHTAGARLDVVETDALFACRVQPDESIWVRGVKRWTLYGAPTRAARERAAGFFGKEHPGLEPARNLVERGLTDFGALVHAPTVVLNATRVDRGEPFLFYLDGWSPGTVRVLEQMAVEFAAVASAYGATLVVPAELLDRYYGCETASVLTAMRTVPNYRDSMAPTSLDHRYLREDIGMTLVPARELARLARLETPTIDSVIHLASVLLGADLAGGGRTLARLGWGGLAYPELRRLLDA